MVVVTKQKIDGVNRRVREHIKEAKVVFKIIRSGFADKSIEGKAATVKLKLDRTLEKLRELIQQIEEDPRNEVPIEEYHDSQYSAEDAISELDVLIGIAKERWQVEEKEKEKRLEAEQREKERKIEINAELEKERIRVEEKIQLEKIHMERFRIEVGAKHCTEITLPAEPKEKEMIAAETSTDAKDVETKITEHDTKQVEPTKPQSGEADSTVRT